MRQQARGEMLGRNVLGFGEAGVGGTYRLARGLEAYANVNAHVRFRKWTRVGGTGYAGVRVLFD